MNKPPPPTRHRTWAGPIAMGVLTASGLATALVSDSWGDWWSWVGLGIPTLAMGWFGWFASWPDSRSESTVRKHQEPLR